MWTCWHLLCLMCRNSFQVVWRWILGSTSEFLWSLGLGAPRGPAPLSNLTFGRATSAGLVMTCSTYHAGHMARILNNLKLTKTYIRKDQKVKDVSTFADTWGFGSAFNGFRQVGGSSQTGSHCLRLSECLLQLGFALALELERDWGGRVWKGACSARFGKRPSFWDPLRRQSWRYVFFPQNFPRSVVIISFHSAKNQEALITVPHFSQDYWKKWVFAYFPAECGIWSWCFLFVILILNLCLHTLHTSFSACLTFCIVHLLTDSLCKVVLLIVSPYKKGPWRSGHPTIHMESPLTSFVYSYPLQTTNSPFWKPVTYRHICEASPAHGGKALSHVSPERGRAALVGQTCALAAWAAFLTAWGKGDAFMRCWKWDSMKNGSRVILVHL